MLVSLNNIIKYITMSLIHYLTTNQLKKLLKETNFLSETKTEVSKELERRKLKKNK